MSYAADGALEPSWVNDPECDCEGACGDECGDDCYCPGHNEECGTCGYFPCACDAFYEAYKNGD